MRSTLVLSTFLAYLFAAQPATAQLGGLLDRVKRKADDAAAEVRRDAEPLTDVERKAEAEVDRARADAEQAVPTEQKVERSVESEIEGTQAVRAGRAVERDVNDIATADERAATAARSEVRRAGNELERQTDVETRAQVEIEQTDAGAAGREAQRDLRTVTTADERARADAEREIRKLERVVEDATDLD